MSWNDVTRDNTNGNTDKIPYTKFNSGNTTIRILDAEPYSFWQHWFQKQQTSITCPGKDCPVCNIIKQMKANKETPMYNSSQRHAIRIWNYDTNQMEIMIQGKVFFSQLHDLLSEIGDLRTFDIKVVRKGEKTDTVYTLIPKQPEDFVMEGKDIKEVNYDEIFKAPTKEEILQLMEGKSWSDINGSDVA